MCRPTSRLLLIASLVSLQIGWSVPNASAQARSQITPGMPADTTVELPPPAGIASTNDDAIGASDVGLASDVGFACGRYGGCGNMTSHGGPVQHNQKVFTIFWAGNAGYTFPSGYQSTINQFVQDLNGSTYYGIAKQYGDTNGFLSPQLIYGGTWLDTVNAIPFPTSGDPSYAQLLAEVNRAKIANPSWISDQNTYFQVYTPNGFVGSQQYCGFHYFSSLPIGLVLYPWSINGYGCFPGGTYPNGSAIDAAISVSAHEILETATDPTGAGWYYESWDGEIGDLCAWIFGPRASDGSN